jgi:hypothetical protein
MVLCAAELGSASVSAMRPASVPGESASILRSGSGVRDATKCRRRGSKLSTSSFDIIGASGVFTIAAGGAVAGAMLHKSAVVRRRRGGEYSTCVSSLNTLSWEDYVKKTSTLLVGGALALAFLTSAVAPAFALGGCGPNMHRGYGNRCYWGGQNQDWCLRKTGHPAQRMPNGEMACFR